MPSSVTAVIVNTTSTTASSTVSNTISKTNSTATASSEQVLPIKKITKRGPRRKCCFVGCIHNERTDPNIKSIISLPKRKRDANIDRVSEVRTYFRKKMKRDYFLKKCKKKDEGRRYFICSHHEMEEVTKKMTLERTTKCKKFKIEVEHTFMAPTGKGVKADEKPMRKSRGLGNDRMRNRLVENVASEITNLDTSETPQVQTLVSAAKDNAFLLMQALEEKDRLKAECERLLKENNELKNRLRNHL